MSPVLQHGADVRSRFQARSSLPRPSSDGARITPTPARCSAVRAHARSARAAGIRDRQSARACMNVARLPPRPPCALQRAGPIERQQHRRCSSDSNAGAARATATQSLLERRSRTRSMAPGSPHGTRSAMLRAWKRSCDAHRPAIRAPSRRAIGSRRRPRNVSRPWRSSGG